MGLWAPGWEGNRDLQHPLQPLCQKTGWEAKHRAQIQLWLRIVLGFKTVKCTYMQGLILPVSYRFLVSSLHRIKISFEIGKLCRVGNAISVRAHIPQGGLPDTGSHSMSGLCGRRQDTVEKGKFCKSLMFRKKKASGSFEKLETLPKVGCRMSTRLPPPCTRDTVSTLNHSSTTSLQPLLAF